MKPNKPRTLCYEVDVTQPLRLTSCGIREPSEPFPQQKRELPEFIAFLCVRGEIRLTDFMEQGEEQIVIRPGEIHIVAPGIYQASTVPFPAGSKFLWFHFRFEAPYRALDRESAGKLVMNWYKPREKPAAQPCWLIPRHLVLSADLDALTAMHHELLENAKLWGQDDAGSASICTHMVYTLHRAVVRGVLREKSMSRLSPELAHVGRARTFIALNYERDISLAEVAAAVKLNPSYLSRCFRKIMKQTVVEFIIATRLQAAKSLLAEESNPPSIKAVAFDTGFKSAAYFCRLFRRYERQTAMEYAARIRAR